MPGMGHMSRMWLLLLLGNGSASAQSPCPACGRPTPSCECDNRTDVGVPLYIPNQDGKSVLDHNNIREELASGFGVHEYSVSSSLSVRTEELRTLASSTNINHTKQYDWIPVDHIASKDAL
eukprot:6006290-Pyramimonas_sp.AAC.1